MRRFLSFMAIAMALFGATAANASVVWTLNNFTFNDGSQATGTFTWDEVLNRATAWHIETTAGRLAAFTYTDANSTMFLSGNADVLNFAFGARQFRIGVLNADVFDTASAHLAPFASNPGLVGPAGYVECINCSPNRIGLTGAYLSADVPTNVPEPATAALSLLALGLLGLSRRRV